MKKQNPNERCKFFRGVYVGSCDAGVVFSQVEDRNRVDQAPRYPCCPIDGAFITCPKYQRDLEWERLNKSVGRQIKIIKEGYASKADPGLLLGITIDKRDAFVSFLRKGNQSRPKRVKVERVRILRGKTKNIFVPTLVSIDDDSILREPQPVVVTEMGKDA